MFVRSMIIDTATSYKHLAFYNIESEWVSVAGGQLMRWKAFFKAMFSWRNLSIFSEFPVESLIFYIGAAAVVVLIKQC